MATGPVSLGWVPDIAAGGETSLQPCFESLLRTDHKGNIYPWLAESYQVSDDLKSINFILRKGVKFHDGSDFNAEVAKWNLDNLIQAQKVPNWGSVDILDNYAIRVNFVAAATGGGPPPGGAPGMPPGGPPSGGGPPPGGAPGCRVVAHHPVYRLPPVVLSPIYGTRPCRYLLQILLLTTSWFPKQLMIRMVKIGWPLIPWGQGPLSLLAFNEMSISNLTRIRITGKKANLTWMALNSYFRQIP